MKVFVNIGYSEVRGCFWSNKYGWSHLLSDATIYHNDEPFPHSDIAEYVESADFDVVSAIFERIWKDLRG